MAAGIAVDEELLLAAAACGLTTNAGALMLAGGGLGRLFMGGEPSAMAATESGAAMASKPGWLLAAPGGLGRAFGLPMVVSLRFTSTTLADPMCTSSVFNVAPMPSHSALKEPNKAFESGTSEPQNNGSVP